MSIFAIGDLHLAMDPRVEKPMDIFGEEWVDHAEKLKTSWLQTVSPGDTVIICGDISWGLRLEEARADFEWLRALPGKKLIFKGNHDLWWQSAGKLNRLYGDEDLIFVQNSACVVTADDGKKVAVCGSRGWIWTTRGSGGNLNACPPACSMWCPAAARSSATCWWTTPGCGWSPSPAPAPWGGLLPSGLPVT